MNGVPTLLDDNGQYTDFMAYNAFVRGSSSNAAIHTQFARHRQTFKAREYVAFEPTALRVGEPLDAFLPKKPTIKKTLSGVEIEGVEYLAVAGLSEQQKEGKMVRDVVLIGEVVISRRSQILSPSLMSGFHRDIHLGGNSVSSVA